MVERKLASIQLISELNPIAGADSIERATVMGWSVVVKKGEFKPGDLCVFFEIDSVLPEGEPWAEFLRPKNFRVKTMKMRGCLSQGLALPLLVALAAEKWDPSMGDIDCRGPFQEGDDVTQLLGITKYESPETQGFEAAGAFPSDIYKTDEIRLQSIPGILDELKQAPFYVTVKLDGMSGTFIRRPNGLEVCSRNNSLKENDCAHWRVAKKYDLVNRLPVGLAVQGEVCGPGIQKNRLKLKGVDLFIFNAFDMNARRYLDWDSLCFLCHRLGLKTVPFDFDVDADELKNFPFTLDNFLELAKGEYPGTGNRREGIVVKPYYNRPSNILNGERLSFKVINNDWLLKDEE